MLERPTAGWATGAGWGAAGRGGGAPVAPPAAVASAAPRNVRRPRASPPRVLQHHAARFLEGDSGGTGSAARVAEKVAAQAQAQAPAAPAAVASNGGGGSGLVLPGPYQRQQQRQQQQQQQPQGGAPPGIEIATGGAAVAAAAAAAHAAQQQQQLLQQQRGHAPAPAAEAKKPLRISWAGSGIYFWWQLGAMQYLATRYDLTRVPQGGASGGALCAVLARCGVDPEEITESAYKLSVDHKIWDRPLGLVGVWGGIIEAWLDALLPHDAAERCRGELGVVVTQLPSCRQVWIDDFKDKHDLITCCMASAHVPLLLDWKLARRCRGLPCVDGSFPDFFTGANCDHIQWGGDAVVFDYFFDPNIPRNGRMDMLQLKQYSEIKRLALMGARYAARLEAEGAFAPFDTEPYRLAK